MKHPNIRIARLKEMIALEEKRASLQYSITVVSERLATIQKELYGSAAAESIANDRQMPARKSKGTRKGRGELKGQILEMLNAAGKSGVTVKELAERIGVKTVNIHAWFSANLKKIDGLKKVGLARYAVNGSIVPPVKVEKKKKAAKAKKVKAPKAEKAKASKKGKAVKKGKSVRGQLKQQILDALKKAGSKGITVKELADDLKANYKNIYIWFVTTGKKIPGIKKVGPAQYKLEA